MRDAGSQVRELSESKAVLERNISILYDTAKLEIARKDAEVKRLRDMCVRMISSHAHAAAHAPPLPGCKPSPQMRARKDTTFVALDSLAIAPASCQLYAVREGDCAARTCRRNYMYTTLYRETACGSHINPLAFTRARELTLTTGDGF